MRTKYGVTIVGVKTPRCGLHLRTPETEVDPGDLLIVAGSTAAVEKFAAIT